MTVLHDRLETPFADRLLRRRSQNRGATQYVEILNDAIGSDDRLQHHRSLHIHVLRQQRITTPVAQRLGRYSLALGCVRGGRGMSGVDGSAAGCCDLNLRGVGSRMNAAMRASCHYFNVERRQHSPIGGHNWASADAGSAEFVADGVCFFGRWCWDCERPLGYARRRFGDMRAEGSAALGIYSGLLGAEPELPVFQYNAGQGNQQENEGEKKPVGLLTLRAGRSLRGCNGRSWFQFQHCLLDLEVCHDDVTILRQRVSETTMARGGGMGAREGHEHKASNRPCAFGRHDLCVGSLAYSDVGAWQNDIPKQ